jgi:hypothetical protein
MMPILTFNLELGNLISGINPATVPLNTSFLTYKVARPDPFKLEEIILEAEKLPPLIST